MSAADVAYVTAWEQQTGIKLNLAFNGVGACTAPTASSANCSGTYNGYTDPGFVADSSAPDDAGLVSALLGAQVEVQLDQPHLVAPVPGLHQRRSAGAVVGDGQRLGREPGGRDLQL